MTENVLGKENGAVGTSVSLTADKINNEDGYSASCNFGDCGMDHKIVTVTEAGNTVER